MNYIYDIYLNFNEVLYDFFDWCKNDEIIHIKKIPIFKIQSKDLIKVINNDIAINEYFLNKIHNKTEVWDNILPINNCCIFTDSYSLIAILFDNKGNSIKKSHLNIDEELDILDSNINIKTTNIEIKILNKKTSILKTRKELKDIEYIKKELNNINNDKLNYIYYECFNKKENNNDKIKKKLLKVNNNNYEKLYNLLKKTSTKKN